VTVVLIVCRCCRDDAIQRDGSYVQEYIQAHYLNIEADLMQWIEQRAVRTVVPYAPCPSHTLDVPPRCAVVVCLVFCVVDVMAVVLPASFAVAETVSVAVY
jgi:hypothetical protein